MKIGLIAAFAMGAIASVLAFGCQRKVDVSVELDKAVKSFPPEQQNAPAAPATVAGPTSAQAMNTAVAAYKSGDLPTAVVQLQRLRGAPVMSPQQRIAVNEAMAAVMADIYARAAKGDAQAIEAVKRAEMMQNQ
jgi:hypothetical protein